MCCLFIFFRQKLCQEQHQQLDILFKYNFTLNFKGAMCKIRLVRDDLCFAWKADENRRQQQWVETKHFTVHPVRLDEE